MSLQTTFLFKEVPGAAYSAFAELVGDTSYPTGGYEVTPDLFKSPKIEAVGVISCSGGLVAEYDRATKKVKLFYPTGGGETSPAALADPTTKAQTVTMGGAATGAVPAGATPVTSTGAQPDVSVPAAGLTATAATGALNPGRGKELKAATNVSTIKINLIAFVR